MNTLKLRPFYLNTSKIYKRIEKHVHIIYEQIFMEFCFGRELNNDDRRSARTRWETRAFFEFSRLSHTPDRPDPLEFSTLLIFIFYFSFSLLVEFFTGRSEQPSRKLKVYAEASGEIRRRMNKILILSWIKNVCIFEYVLSVEICIPLLYIH